MLISASIFSDKTRDIADLIGEIQESTADMIHFDFPVNTAPDFELLSQLRKKSRLPFDGHLIHKQPEQFLPQLEKLGFDQIAIQAELLSEDLLSESYVEKYNMRVGLAIQAKEGFEQYIEKLDQFDYALVMATIPGVSGMKFQESAYEVIQSVKKHYPQMPIEVDGGVNEEISKKLLELKVDIAVSGSSLINTQPMKAELAKLVGRESRHFFKKILIPAARSPKVFLDTDFQGLIETIDFYKLGGAMVTDETERLLGIITNGDLRHMISQYREGIFQMKVEEFYNKNPRCLYVDMDQREVLQMVTSIPHYLSLIPVLDRSNKIVGSTSSDQVIRCR